MSEEDWWFVVAGCVLATVAVGVVLVLSLSSARRTLVGKRGSA